MDADNLPKAFGDYVQAPGPIALFTFKPSEDALRAMKSGIERVRKEAEDVTSKRTFLVIEEAQMCLYNKKECRTETRMVSILNINASRKILPRISAALALRMEANPITELSVAIVEPMCYDLGLESWWKSVVNMSMPQLKKTLTSLVEIPSKMWKPKDSQIFIRRNRALKWRDQDILEGRILTVMAVPNELVNDVMAISGKHGLIIDLAKREVKEQSETELAHVRLPEEMGIKEALKKLEEMPKRARETTRGLIPTRRGFALRVCKEAEGEITTHLNPAEASRLGPALGIRPKSAWVIKGVPGYADTGMIVKTIAQANDSWPGWIVRPRRPLTASRGKVTTWLVDAVVEPPSTVITLNGYIINIEKYVEAPSTGKRAAAWHSIKPKITHEIIPGQIYQDEDDAAAAKSSIEEGSPYQNVKLPVEQKPKTADVVMQPMESPETRTTKRKVQDTEKRQTTKRKRARLPTTRTLSSRSCSKGWNKRTTRSRRCCQRSTCCKRNWMLSVTSCSRATRELPAQRTNPTVPTFEDAGAGPLRPSRPLAPRRMRTWSMTVRKQRLKPPLIVPLSTANRTSP